MMSRTIGVERVFALKPYETLRLVDFINDLPEEVYDNDKALRFLRGIQFLNLELNYRKYLRLLNTLNPLNVEDSIQLLEELKVNTYSELEKALDKKG